MQPKDNRRSRGSTPSASQHPSKNINISISYNITLGKQNKPVGISSIPQEENRKKRPKVEIVERREKPNPRDKQPLEHLLLSTDESHLEEQPRIRRDKPDAALASLGSSYLQSKPLKGQKKKKPLNALSRTQQTRIGTAKTYNSVKFLTQEPETTNVEDLHRHCRVMSKDRQDIRNKVKSSQHSRRNNSDGSKAAQPLPYASKELKKRLDKRKKSKSVDMTRPKPRGSVPNNRSRVDSSMLQDGPKRRRVDTQQRQYTREQSPEDEPYRPNETLVDKLIRTEISSIGGQPTQSSPDARITERLLNKKTQGTDKPARLPTEQAFTKKKQSFPTSPIKKVRIKSSLTDKLREDAARKIQRMWRAYKKRQLLSFYGDMFTRNCQSRASEHSVKTPSFEQMSSPPKAQPRRADTSQFAILTIDQYKQRSRQQSEEELSEQFQFNIRKYEDIVERTIEDQRHRQLTYPEESYCSPENSELRSADASVYSAKKSECSRRDEIEYFKAHQLEQWNKINTLISENLTDTSRHEQLLRQLIQYTETNKKWIEAQSSLASGQFGTPDQRHTLPIRYRELVEETNIVQKLKNKSSSQKRCIESRLDQCGTLGSSSSKKHPHVYLGVDDKPLHNQARQVQGFTLRTIKHMPNKDEPKQQYSFEPASLERRPRAGVQHHEHLSQENKMEAYVDEVISEEASERGTPKSGPVENWWRLSLQNIRGPQPQYSTPTTKEGMKDRLRSQEMSKYMRRQMFTRQAVFQAILQLQFTNVCDELISIKAIQAKALAPKSPFKLAKRPIPTTAKGIRTDFAQIKRYMNCLIDYVLTQADQLEVGNILRNINYPLGPSSKEVLEYLCVREVTDGSSSEKSPQDSTEYVINITSFHKCERKRQTNQKVNEKFRAYACFWHQSIFEAFNECLDEFRPYGVYGQPYAWEVDGRIHTARIIREDLPVVLKLAAEKLYSHATVMAGIIFDKDDSPVVDSVILEQTKREVNEERMSRMLANILLEEETNFINYKDEVVELQIELSYTLVEFVLREAAVEVSRFTRRGSA